MSAPLRDDALAVRAGRCISAFCFLLSAFCFLFLASALGQDYQVPTDVFVAPEQASQQALDQSLSRTSLRFWGLDLFPYATANTFYDDNILISHTRPISDVHWVFAPGLTVTAGDIATTVPGSVTLTQVRDLAYYSLMGDSSRPQRFVGVNYTPGFNFFTQNPQYNYIDQVENLSAGYNFSRLALGLDQNYAYQHVKSSNVGDLITIGQFDTKLRGRYELSDRSSVEANLRYYWLDYPSEPYQGYQEIRNEDWFNRLLGSRLEVGLGAAFGFAYPQNSPNQAYQDALVRAVYHASGKLDLRTSLGLELREYAADQANTLTPVFSISAAYQPRASTTFGLEAHRNEQPSYNSGYNYLTTGFNVGVRQQLSTPLSAGLTGGYDYIQYVYLGSGQGDHRVDNLFWIRASLNYEFNRHLTASLYYTMQEDDSSQRQYSYTDNIVGIQVEWRY
jgi:hypothetical protein